MFKEIIKTKQKNPKKIADEPFLIKFIWMTIWTDFDFELKKWNEIAHCKCNIYYTQKFCLVLEKENEKQGGAVSKSGQVLVS